MIIGAIDTLMMTMVMLMKIVILMTKIKLNIEASRYTGDIGGDLKSCGNDLGQLELPTLCTLMMNLLSGSKSHPVDDSFCL